MKFHINSLHIWLNNGKRRDLNFLPNRINVITGDSNTGKTAILDIIDYCLASTTSSISESVIDEKSLWYGINININKKNVTIARKSPQNGEPSNIFYFSSAGYIPEELPEKNLSHTAIREFLNNEFSVGKHLKMPYGGRNIRASSRISFRYFLLFNKLSQNTITHSDIFFDTKGKDRYKDALNRIFDIAVSIDTIENSLMKNRYENLRDEKERYIRKKERIKVEKKNFFTEEDSYKAKAIHYGLIKPTDDFRQKIEKIISEGSNRKYSTEHNEYESLSSELYETSRKINGLNKFLNSYKKYKLNLTRTGDSLEPINYINKNYHKLIRTPVFQEIIDNLSDSLQKIKEATSDKTPIDGDIIQKIHDLKRKEEEIVLKMKNIPGSEEYFSNQREEGIFIGEIKAKLSLFSENGKEISDIDNHINSIERKLESIKFKTNEENRIEFITFLNGIIDGYIKETKNAIENYKDYKSYFNYSEKKLYLRKFNQRHPENIGSTSNHLFLHLYLFLGLHQAIIQNKGQYVAPFLIIDQLSRPFWDGSENSLFSYNTINKSDVEKVRTALELLNFFMKNIGEDFQIILFEHIEPELWKNLDYFHLVEEFRGGNALIPRT